MDEHYENGPEGMPRVKRMTDSTLGWVASPITLLQLFQAHPGGQEALNQFAHAVAEETLARLPAWGAVPQANAEQDTARLDFVISHRVSWYPGYHDGQWHGGQARGTLCYGRNREQVEGATMREAIDAAIAASNAASDPTK